MKILMGGSIAPCMRDHMIIQVDPSKQLLVKGMSSSYSYMELLSSWKNIYGTRIKEPSAILACKIILWPVPILTRDR